MTSLSPKFPLHFSDLGGYSSNETIKQVIKQNFKNLILTSPGERVMLPEFGVGIRQFLFQPNIRENVPVIINRVKKQISIYMPFIELQEFLPTYDENQLIIVIKYYIIPLASADILNITAR